MHHLRKEKSFILILMVQALSLKQQFLMTKKNCVLRPIILKH